MCSRRICRASQKHMTEAVCRARALGSTVEVERLIVALNRIALRLPACQSTFEESYPRKMQRPSSTRDDSAGFIIGAGAVDDRLFLFRDERWILQQVFGGNPGGAGD